jgi:signal transduction histidine kinase
MIAGRLPEDMTKGKLFVDIIREGVTNAVRHGYATQISVEIDNSDGACRLAITDNGHPISETITEGGGLSGMRKKLEPYGGALNVTPHPRFSLMVDLPRG